MNAVNPFYAGRVGCRPRVATPREARDRPVYAKLPRVPISASPVPHLTSLYHFDGADKYGNRGYPGNCGGNLIRDLLRYFTPGLVLDPMSGSGTCAEVCDDLGIPCMAWDIHRGIDACDGAGFGEHAFDFIWVHPPYWRQKLYADDPRDLSRAASLDEFLRRLAVFFRNCRRALKDGGKLAVLVGDYIDREAGFLPLTWHCKRLAFEAGLRQHCTDIIRFGHGASSGRKTYSGPVIPGLHDVCMIFQKGRSNVKR